MISQVETSGSYAAEEWPIPANWVEDTAVKAKWRRIKYGTVHEDRHFFKFSQSQLDFLVLLLI